jgi:Rod binding domain-containing protein
MDAIGAVRSDLTAAPTAPGKWQEAAKQFESLLISELLKSAQSGEEWGTSDAAAQTAVGHAQEQLAQSIAAQGGLGLGRLLERSWGQQPSLAAEPGREKNSNTAVPHR